MFYKYIIIGAGIAGLTIAERITNVLQEEVLLIEKRENIGGNLWDTYDTDGIFVQKYGPHIFHTTDKEVYRYLSRFTEWNAYQHRVVSYVDGQLVPFPINLDTLSLLFHESFTKQKAEAYFREHCVEKTQILSSRDLALSQIGEELYDAFYKNYTIKQWGYSAEQLDPSIFGRIPVRRNSDNRYFTDPYQGIPKHGFSQLCRNMLNSRMRILLNTDFQKVRDSISYETLVYTGPLDEYFNYQKGKLPYRHLQFKFETHNQSSYQSNAVINYPNDFEYTRVTEFKYLTNQRHDKTVILKEFPSDEGECCYPILCRESKDMVNQYKEIIQKEKNVIFLGRLAQFRYFNIDQVVKEALNAFNNISKN